VPPEDEIPADEIGRLIDRALAECEERGTTGKDITPFLLGRVVELSGGRSLDTNIALVRSNARLGAALAVAYGRLTA
jgi:pseudouridine-5'-phosphate glycosidase